MKTKKKARVPTLADKYDSAQVSLREARKKIKTLQARPGLDGPQLRAKVVAAAVAVLEAHGIMDAATMLAESIATRVVEEMETEEVPA